MRARRRGLGAGDLEIVSRLRDLLLQDAAGGFGRLQPIDRRFGAELGRGRLGGAVADVIARPHHQPTQADRDRGQSGGHADQPARSPHRQLGAP